MGGAVWGGPKMKRRTLSWLGPMLGSWQAKFTLFIGLMYIIGQLTGFYPIVSAFQAAGSVLSHLVSGVPSDPNSVAPLLRTVTSEVDDAARIFQRYLRRADMANPGSNLERDFRAFLIEEAAGPRRRAERRLEWVMLAYRFIIPFLIFALLIRFTSRDEGSKDAHGGDAHAAALRHATPPAKAGHKRQPTPRLDRHAADTPSTVKLASGGRKTPQGPRNEPGRAAAREGLPKLPARPGTLRETSGQQGGKQGGKREAWPQDWPEGPTHGHGWHLQMLVGATPNGNKALGGAHAPFGRLSHEPAGLVDGGARGRVR